MRIPSLPPKAQVEDKFEALDQLQKRVREEYRWAIEYVYTQDRLGDSSKGSGPSDPVSHIVVEKENARNLVLSAIRRIDDAIESLRSAYGLLDEAQPRYSPALGVLAPHATQAEIQESRRMQEKRGQRYGQA